jgi:hypothetical protein
MEKKNQFIVDLSGYGDLTETEIDAVKQALLETALQKMKTIIAERGEGSMSAEGDQPYLKGWVVWERHL